MNLDDFDEYQDFGDAPPRQPKQQPRPMNTATKKFKVTLLPNLVFPIALGVWSIMINMYNLYTAFAPAASERFAASGIAWAIQSMPFYPVLSTAFRIGMAAVVYLLYKAIAKNGLWRNYIWMGLLAVCGYVAVVGLIGTLSTFALIFAALVVLALQHYEISFWSTPKAKRTLTQFAIVFAAYAVEIWLQYDMAPIHRDYDTFTGLLTAMTSLQSGFDWGGFMLLQSIFALTGVFGIELAERLLQGSLRSSHG